MSILPRWLRNKYLLASGFFLAWMLFFDHNDVFTQMTRSRELSGLKSSKAYYQEQIAQTRAAVERIRINPLALEKIAREKFLMRRDGEDVFVVAPRN
jgi:cell division protein FtsB